MPSITAIKLGFKLGCL